MKGVESSRKIRGGEINVYACDALFIIGSNNSRNNEEDKNPRRSSSTRAEFVGPQKEQMKFPFLLGAVGAIRFNPRQRI